MMGWKSRLTRLAIPFTTAVVVATQIPSYQLAMASDGYSLGTDSTPSGLKAVSIAGMGAGLFFIISSKGSATSSTSTTSNDSSSSTSSFANLADQAGIVGSLQTDGDKTAFVPTNAAIAKLDPNLLKPENKDQLADVLRSHILIGRFTLDELKSAVRDSGTTGRKYRTLAGTDVTVTVQDDTLHINGVAIKDTPKMTASNGLAYPIDTILPHS